MKVKAVILGAVPMGVGVGVGMAVGHELEQTNYLLRLLAIGVSAAGIGILLRLVLQKVLQGD